MTIDSGNVGEVILTVTPSDTAARFSIEVGENYPEVLATACMIREMERAAAKLMRPLLGPGQLSVGVRVEVGHVAPTPVGGIVTTRARFTGRPERGTNARETPTSTAAIPTHRHTTGATPAARVSGRRGLRAAARGEGGAVTSVGEWPMGCAATAPSACRASTASQASWAAR